MRALSIRRSLSSSFSPLLPQSPSLLSPSSRLLPSVTPRSSLSSSSFSPLLSQSSSPLLSFRYYSENAARDGGKEGEGEGENLRVLLRNFPKFWKKEKILGWLNDPNAGPPINAEVKKSPHTNFAVFTFPNMEEKKVALSRFPQLLQGATRHVFVVANPEVHQRKQKKNIATCAADAVTPLHSLSYDEQLQKKSQQLRSLLDSFELNLIRNSNEHNLPDWVIHLQNKQKEKDQKKQKRREREKEWLARVRAVEAQEQEVSPAEWEKEREEWEEEKAMWKREREEDRKEWMKEKERVSLTYDGILTTKTYGYRNNLDFTIAKSTEGNTEIGYVISRVEDQKIVDSPKGCYNTPHEAVIVADVVRGAVETSSLDDSFWKGLRIRFAENPRQMMVIFQVNPNNHSDEEVKNAKQNMTDFLVSQSSGPLSSFPPPPPPSSSHPDASLQNHPDSPNPFESLVSVVFQEYSGPSVGSNLEYEVTWGTPSLTDTIPHPLSSSSADFLKFQISPNSFFQVNRAGMSRLLEVVTGWFDDCVGGRGEDGEHGRLVDVCCGAGSFGLSLAGRVGEVVGVELLEEAVEDARKNAKQNNIHNCEFFAGRAEEILPNLLKNQEHKKTVGIVNPPRAGLHKSVIHSIREAEEIDFLIYISCSPKNLIADAIDFCRGESKKFQGVPFQPVRAVGVDMFPHTDHVETVMLFERSASGTVNHQMSARKVQDALYPQGKEKKQEKQEGNA